MKLPFFLREKRNQRTLDDTILKEVSIQQNNNTIPDEKDKLLEKINQDDLQYFFSFYQLDKDNISLDFLNRLNANPDLLKYLNQHFIKSDFIQKINQNSFSINDIENYDKGLLQFDIFIDSDKPLLDILRKQVIASDKVYTKFDFDDFEKKNGFDKVLQVTIPSSTDEELVIEKQKAILLNTNNVYHDNKISLAFSLDNNKIYCGTDDIFNRYYCGEISLSDDTILFIPYKEFIKWSKDPNKLNILNTVQVVINDDFDKVFHLSNQMKWCYQNYHESLSLSYVDKIIAKTNHLLYLVENSELNEDDKEFYIYSIEKEAQNFDKRIRMFSIETDLKNIAIELQKKIELEKIHQLTTSFNELSKDDKLKKVENPKFSVDVFLRKFKNFDKISSFGFLEVFSNLTPEQKNEVLSNYKAIQKLQGLLQESANDEYYYYERLVSLLDIDDIFKIFDADFIKNYYKNNRYQNEYRFFYQILEKDINKAMEYLLIDDNYFNEFVKNISNFSFNKLDYSLLVKMIKKIDNSNLNNNVISLYAVNSANQFKLLKEDFSDDMLVAIVKVASKDVQQFFYLEDTRFHYLWEKFNVIDLASAGYKLTDIVTNKKEFFDKFKSVSIVQFRANVNQFMIHQPNIFFEEKITAYENELILQYDLQSGLFQQYQYLLDNVQSLDNLVRQKNNYFYNYDIYDGLRSCLKRDDDDKLVIKDRDNLIVYLQQLSKQKLNEILVDLLFKDNIYNVFLNIKEMLRFNTRLSNNEKILDDDKIKFYETILNLDHLNKEVILNIYHSFKDKNVALMFYEDLQKVKNNCYDKIRNELFQPEEMKNKEDKDKSLKYGLPIYDLRDKEYVMLVRCLGNNYDRDTIHKRDCYTLLSNENSNVMHDDSYIYGYSGFDNDCVLHMFEGDSFSGDVKLNDLNAGSERVNRIMTSQEIVTNSYIYSEVQIVNKKQDNNNNLFEALKPSFLVVYDEVNDKILNEAKRMNIPICIISKTRNRTLESQIPFDDKVDKYVRDNWADNEEERRKHR